MKRLSVIRHGHCQTCGEDKTVGIYRVDGVIQPPVCGACKLEQEADDEAV